MLAELEAGAVAAAGFDLGRSCEKNNSVMAMNQTSRGGEREGRSTAFISFCRNLMASFPNGRKPPVLSSFWPRRWPRMLWVVLSRKAANTTSRAGMPGDQVYPQLSIADRRLSGLAG